MEREAHRIANELVKLHKAGAIKGDQDASFHANLVLFGASFTVRVGPYAPKPGAPNGFTVPEPGKPYTPTEAQRVKVPRGLSRKQEAEFLARDLEEALACEPTPEEPGESVLDLTGDVTSQSAPTVSGADRPRQVRKCKDGDPYRNVLHPIGHCLTPLKWTEL